MKHPTYLRYEVLRTFRNRRFLLFSLGFPLLLFFPHRGDQPQSPSRRHFVPPLLHDGHGVLGTMVAVISSGARIAAERQIGWTRQLRITPLATSAYFRAKVVCGYLMAVLSLVVLYAAGTSLGVRLSAGEWLTMTVLLLIGLIPFAVLGILLGHLLSVDSMGPAMGGTTTLFALLGGSWGRWRPVACSSPW